MTAGPASLLTWTHTIKSVGPRGVTVNRQATAAECEQLRSNLDVVAVEQFHARYTLTQQSGAAVLLAGGFTAKLTQACIVTLEPVSQTLDEEFAVTFAPPHKVAEPGTAERSVLEEPDIEVLTGDTIDAGRVLFELLSAAIDPYPRKDTAQFDWQDPKSGPDVAEALNPFAALSKFKAKD